MNEKIEELFGEKELCIFHEAKELVPSMSVLVEQCEINHFRHLLCKSFKAPDRFSFPGSNPVSLERKNILQLYNEDYLVALKTDGVRYVLMMSMIDGAPRAVMVNRALKFYEVEVWADIDFFEKNTVFDGELVWERKGDSLSLLYMAFDIIMIKGESCMSMKFSDRVNKFHNLIANLNSDDSLEQMEQKIIDEKTIAFVNNMNNMRILPKKFVSMSHIQTIWEDRQRLNHKNDGIIFTKNASEIKIGTDYESFKWKPENTVDVFFDFGTREISVRNGKKFEAFDTAHVQSTQLKVHFCENKLIQCLSETIANSKVKKMVIECSCKIDSQSNTVMLFPVKNRSDRETPNDKHTIESTIKNIQESVDIQDIINARVECSGKTIASDLNSSKGIETKAVANASGPGRRPSKRKTDEPPPVHNQRIRTRSRSKTVGKQEIEGGNE